MLGTDAAWLLAWWATGGARPPGCGTCMALWAPQLQRFFRERASLGATTAEPERLRGRRMVLLYDSNTKVLL